MYWPSWRVGAERMAAPGARIKSQGLRAGIRSKQPAADRAHSPTSSLASKQLPGGSGWGPAWAHILSVGPGFHDGLTPGSILSMELRVINLRYVLLTGPLGLRSTGLNGKVPQSLRRPRAASWRAGGHKRVFRPTPFTWRTTGDRAHRGGV